ncbi:MAG: cytidylate kinase-like family protein [Desulfobacterales bacterium]|nr:cytidylate kinase-like family protein [Desulfobacterales bacterium]
MAIITISRGSYSMGKAVAEAVADRLGYALSSHELLLEAASAFDVPEIKLQSAIHDAPGILSGRRRDKEFYLACIRSALTTRAAEDNLVYHGLAGHFLLKGIPHVCKVRITADMDARIATEADREDISPEQARYRILADDKHRRDWTRALYDVDPWDSNLYDLVVRIDRLRVADAADFIVHTASRFPSTESSRRQVRDLALACRVKARLIPVTHDISVTCHDGNIVVYASKKVPGDRRMKAAVDELKTAQPDIRHLEIHWATPAPDGAI